MRRDGGLSDGVVPMFDGDQLAIEEWVRPPGDVASDKDIVEHHPFVAEDAARRVADHSSGVRRQSGPAEPLRVADGTEGDHGYIDVEHVSIGEWARRSRPSPSSAMTVTSVRMVDTVVALEPGGSTPSGGAQSVIEGRAAALNQRHRESAADGGDLRADKAAADDEDAVWPSGQTPTLTQARRIVPCANREDAIESGFVRVWPLPGAGARGNQHPVKLDLFAVAELDAATARSNATAETPRRHSASMSTNWGKVVCSTAAIRSGPSSRGRSYGG